MRYSKGLVLYQDEPDYGLAFKIVFGVIPAALLGSAFYLLSSGVKRGGWVVLIEFFIIGLILFFLISRSYRIYEDHTGIVLDRPFAINVGFDKIRDIEIPGKLKFDFGVNFVTRFTGKYVAIVLKTGTVISITPRNSELFVENAGRALGQ